MGWISEVWGCTAAVTGGGAGLFRFRAGTGAAPASHDHGTAVQCREKGTRQGRARRAERGPRPGAAAALPWGSREGGPARAAGSGVGRPRPFRVAGGGAGAAVRVGRGPWGGRGMVVGRAGPGRGALRPRSVTQPRPDTGVWVKPPWRLRQRQPGAALAPVRGAELKVLSLRRAVQCHGRGAGLCRVPRDGPAGAGSLDRVTLCGPFPPVPPSGMLVSPISELPPSKVFGKWYYWMSFCLWLDMDNRKDEKSRTLCATSEEGLKARGRCWDLLLFCGVCVSPSVSLTGFFCLVMALDHGTLEEQGKTQPTSQNRGLFCLSSTESHFCRPQLLAGLSLLPCVALRKRKKETKAQQKQILLCFIHIIF